MEKRPADAEDDQQPQEEALYVIDPGWYDEHGFDLAQMVRLRRCSECEASGFARKTAKGRRSRRSTAGTQLSWEEEMGAIGEADAGSAE